MKQENRGENKPNQFLIAIEKLANNDPANEVLTEYASTLFVEQERYADALEWLESLLSEEPTFRTHNGLAKTYHALDMPGKLVALLGQTVDATGDLTIVRSAVDQIVEDEQALSSLRIEANRRRADCSWDNFERQ